MKRLIAAMLCLMLCAGGAGSALGAEMTDCPEAGFMLLTEGEMKNAAGRIEILPGAGETEAGSGIYEGRCAYVNRSDEEKRAFEEKTAGMARDSEEYAALLREYLQDSVLLCIIRALEEGMSASDAGKGLEESIISGRLKEPEEIGRAEGLAFYLLAADPEAEKAQREGEGVPGEVLETAALLAREISAHKEYFRLKKPGLVTCGVKVTDPEGNPVAGVLMNLCTDTLCKPGMTGEDGRNLVCGEPIQYHVQILRVPEGFAWNGEEFYIGPEGEIKTAVLERVN